MTDERIEIQMMKLEDGIVGMLAVLPGWIRVFIYLWFRYVDHMDRDELLPLFERAARDRS